MLFSSQCIVDETNIQGDGSIMRFCGFHSLHSHLFPLTSKNLSPANNVHAAHQVLRWYLWKRCSYIIIWYWSIFQQRGYLLDWMLHCALPVSAVCLPIITTPPLLDAGLSASFFKTCHFKETILKIWFSLDQITSRSHSKKMAFMCVPP